MHGRPRREGHECGEEFPVGVAGPGTEQVGRAPVDAPDGSVPVEHEQRHRSAGEYRAQQTALSAGSIGLRAACCAGIKAGLQRRRGINGTVQLGESGIKQLRQLRPGQGGGLAERA